MAHSDSLPPDFLVLLSSKDYSARMDGLFSLQSELQEGRCTWPGVSFEQLAEMLIDCLSDLRLNICLLGLECFAELCRFFPKRIDSLLARFVAVLFDTLSHQHEQVRGVVYDCLCVFSKFCSFDRVMSLIARVGLTHSSYRVREQLLMILGKFVENGDESSVEIPNHLLPICKCVDDSERIVRISALQLLDDLKSVHTAALDAALEKLSSEEPDLVEKIKQHFDEEFQQEGSCDRPISPESCRSNSSSGSKPESKGPQGKQASNSNWGDEPPEYQVGLTIPVLGEAPIILYSEKDLTKEIDILLELLKDTKADWEKRTDGLRRLWRLIDGGATETSIFIPLLHKLKSALVCQAYDLRSKVPKIACQILSVLAFRLGDKFEPFAEYFFPDMMRNVANTVTIIKESANLCVRSFLFKTRSLFILRKIVEQSSPKVSKDKNIRLRCQEYLYLILNEWSVSVLERSLDLIEEQIRHGITDADEKTRQTARKSFIKIYRLSPEKAQKILTTQDASVQKILLEAMKKANPHTTEFQKPVPKTLQKTSSRKDIGDDMGKSQDILVNRMSGLSISTSASSNRPSVANTTSSSSMSANRGLTQNRLSSSTPKGTYDRLDESLKERDAQKLDSTQGTRSRSNSPQSVSSFSSAKRLTVESNSGSLVASKTNRPTNLKVDTKTTAGASRSTLQSKYGFSNPTSLESSLQSRNTRLSNQASTSPMVKRQAWTSNPTSMSLPSTPAQEGAKTRDIVQIMAINNQTPWEERLQAYQDLQTYFTGHKVDELRVYVDRLVNMYIDRIADPHPKPLISLIDSMESFVTAFGNQLEPHLERLLLKVLDKCADSSESVRRSCEIVMAAFCREFPNDTLLPILVRVIDMSNPKTRMPALKMIANLLPNSSSAASNATVVKLLLQKIAPALGEKTAETRDIAYKIIYSLQAISPVHFQSQLQLLTMNTQDLVRKALTKGGVDLSRSPNSRGTSPSVVDKKSSIPNKALRSPMESDYRPKSPLVTSQDYQKKPLSQTRDVSEREKLNASIDSSSYGYNTAQAGLNSSVMETPVQRKTMSSNLYNSVNSPAHSPSLIPSVNAKRAIAPSINRGYTLSSSFSESSQPTMVVNPTENSLVAPTQATHSREMPRYDPRKYTLGNNLSAQESGGGTNELKSIQQLLSSALTRSEGLHKTLRLSRDKGNPVWQTDIGSIIYSVTCGFSDSQPSIRELTIHVVKEIMVNQTFYFDPHVPNSIHSLLAACRDSTREVVTAAEDALEVIPTLFPTEATFETFIEAISKAESPVLQIAIRVVSRVFQSLQPHYLESKLPFFIPHLFKAFSHDAPDVRKAVVYSLVDLHRCLGQALDPYLETLPSTQRKLVALYISRLQPTSVAM